MIESSVPVRVLVAGAGAFGWEHVTRLLERADAELAAVADSNPAALERVRALGQGVTLHADPLEMIASEEADAMIVATPVDSHVEICIRALQSNLCVLLEKPVARSSGAAAALRRAASIADGFILPGHTLRFSEDHRRLIDIVRSGQLGRPIYVNSRRYRDDAHAFRYPDIDPVLMTLVHDIDLAQWATESEFVSVCARRSAGAGFRNMTAVSALTATGVACDLRTAWTFAGGDLPCDRLEVAGEQGSIELSVGEAFRLFSNGRCIELGVTVADDSLRSEHDHFFACVRDRSRARALDLGQALAGLALADAAMESLRLGREIEVSKWPPGRATPAPRGIARNGESWKA